MQTFLKFISNKTHIFCYCKYHANSVTRIHETLGDIFRRWAKSFHQELERNIRILLNTLVQKSLNTWLGFPVGTRASWNEPCLRWFISWLMGAIERWWCAPLSQLDTVGNYLCRQPQGKHLIFFLGGGKHLYWIVFSLRKEEAWAKGQIRDRICSNEAGTCSELLLRRNFDRENYYKIFHPLNLPPPQLPSITIAITPPLCLPLHSVTITVSEDPAHHCVK